jgi:hypothetical protein
MEPLEVDGVIHRGESVHAVWDIVLSCGHFDTELTEPDWKAEDGPVRNNENQRSLEEILQVLAENQDDEGYYRRMHAENWPKPVPFTRCLICARIRAVVAYERVGWLAAKPKPIKPPEPVPRPRKTIERQLKKLEAEAAQLREELKNRPPDDE